MTKIAELGIALIVTQKQLADVLSQIIFNNPSQGKNLSLGVII
jgi:hypothetical protein